ncbi:MAG: nitroreductase family protein [Desulfobacterales bacterium]|nr:nitroreductase family protein [Desulfobacterales bacterium]
MGAFVVDRETCNRDGLCVRECPAGVIRLGPEDDVPAPQADFKDFCIACGHCVAVCPTAALRLEWLDPNQCPPVDRALQLNREQAEQFLRSRRSIRAFREKPVERAKIEKLLEMACYAPSAKNNQPWHWTVVEQPAEVRRMAGLAVEWMRGVIAEKPNLAKALSFTRVVAAWDSGLERVCRGAPHLIVAHADKNYGFGAEDTALALSYLELYAPVLGLGTCWAGYFYAAANACPPLFEALKLPARHKACGALMVGYPAFRYQRLVPRKPPKVTWT